MKIIYHLFTCACLLLSSASYTQYTTLFNFDGVTSGGLPSGDLVSDGSFLYGLTFGGGSNGKGTIFKIMPDGTGFLKLLDFDDNTNGSNPCGSLIYDGTYLYGMTQLGGLNESGTIFKIKPDGSNYTKLLDFESVTNGGNPKGSLIYDGSFLYGMTLNGGIYNMGTIFKIMPDGSSFVKIKDLDSNLNGSSPHGSLFYDGVYLYGMTKLGGTNFKGTIFKIKPDGTSFFKLLDFSGITNGESPEGSLVSDGTYLYGMTTIGGVNGEGTIFKIMPDGTGFTKLLDFNGPTTGRFPKGSLIIDGVNLYGMTKNGGANGIGTIFKVMNDGTGYVKLFDFDGTTNGRNPLGSLIYDGTFLYGMTYFGGANNSGVIFKYGMTNEILETQKESEFTVYPNPTTGMINISTFNNNLKLVSLTNIMGQEIFSKEYYLNSEIDLTIDLSDQFAGIYFLKIGNSIQRIIRL